MTSIKLTTWNVEHLDRLIGQAGPVPPRARAIVQEIEEIDPDVLCIVEAPANLTALREWVASPDGLRGRYHVPVIPGTDEILAQNPADPRRALQGLYAMQGTATTGHQWIWFLVRDGLFQDSNARLLDPVVWRDLTGQATWPVHLWGSVVAKRHSHWRHPQTLLMELDGIEIEIIGAHLKSKINRLAPFEGDDHTHLRPEFVAEAHEARAKLTTEVSDIRRYIDGRFNQVAEPRIFVCGDLNDGPGRDYFERVYLYHDLVSNLQGDVFFARRFLNHALFDMEEHLRWTTEFTDRIELWDRERSDGAALPTNDPVDRARRQLIDHILFTQALVGEGARPRVRSHAGTVEHTIHQRINAHLSNANTTSDHTPVSVVISY